MRRLSGLLRRDSAPGVLLLAGAALATIVASSPLASAAEALWATPLSVKLGALGLDKPLLVWINDGLMAVFFLLVGLEIKREALEGELSDRRTLALPALGALGGMIVPALIYAAIARGDSVALRGWAIPAATDIAFAVAVLTLLGNRVPQGLKAFLLTLAILDDLGAILLIALFYTANLSAAALVLAAIGVALLAIMNVMGIQRIAPYLVVGFALWICLLESGVHATLAGVAVAFAIPMRTRFHGSEETASPLLSLEHALQPWVTRAILPLFALANAGIALNALDASSIAQSVPLAIVAGLVVGKPLGVFGFSMIARATGIARLPAGVSPSHLFGASLLCGIGFTMSLFIASLAFGEETTVHGRLARLGIMTGSLLSAVAGTIWLQRATTSRTATALPLGDGTVSARR